MDISADIASRITRLFQMSCLVVGIAPYIPGSVSPCDQVILLVVSVGAAVSALVLHADQIIAVVICIPAFGVVPVYDPDRQTSVIIRNLLFRSIRVSDTVHASARIIGHLRAVPDRVCLLNQSAVLIITVMYPGSCQFYIRDASIRIIQIGGAVSRLIGKYRFSVLPVIRCRAFASASCILPDHSAIRIIRICQVNLSRKVCNG